MKGEYCSLKGRQGNYRGVFICNFTSQWCHPDNICSIELAVDNALKELQKVQKQLMLRNKAIDDLVPNCGNCKHFKKKSCKAVRSYKHKDWLATDSCEAYFESKRRARSGGGE